jgi:fused signal recognition particle receptor
MTAPELDELARHLAQLEGVLEDEARALAETAEEFAMARLEAVARSGEMEVIEIEELEKLEALGESMRMSLGARDAEIAAQRALLETEMEKLVARFEGERGVIEEQVAKRLEALGDPERRRLTKERIERQNRRIEERAARIAAEVADRERLLEDASLAAEEMDRLREEARSQAEAARPSLEEMRELHEELRREVDLMRPNLEEQRRVREELRREVDELRERFREDLEQNLEKLRELSASSDAL